ncbi:hypothetical protein J0H58_35950 [bacterium]|nr:hypothetical protein [bacterium]
MTRSMRRAAAAVVAGGLAATGCHGTGTATAHGPNAQPEGWTRYYNAVDPCWPERYNAVARAETLAPFATQVNNGRVLEQTIWNWHFESGSDVITPAGQAKLDAIAQVRPQPDGRVYMQVARDVPAYGAGGLDTVAARREELTAKRAEAVRKYMAAQPSLHGVNYEVFIHDAPVPSMPADFSARGYRGQALGYVGGLSTGGTAVTSTGTGTTTTNTNTAPGGQGPSGPGGPGSPGSGPGTGGSGGPNY